MIRIARRFRGPASSGNGGFTAGQLAGFVSDAPAVEVTLRRPPPLEADLAVVGAGASRLLCEGSDLVAEAVAATPPEPVPGVDVETARAAEQAYPGLLSHPFPECFVCGPAREPGDGMRLLPGRLPEGRTACTWTPERSLAERHEWVHPAFVWAALDCPGGWTGDLAGRPMVLGRIAVALGTAIRVGETYVIVGALLGSEGRKAYTASTVYDAEGRPCGRARHTWIRVDPAHFR